MHDFLGPSWGSDHYLCPPPPLVVVFSATAATATITTLACLQVKDLAEAQEFQLERLMSIVSSLVAVTSATNAGTRAANSVGSADLFQQVRFHIFWFGPTWVPFCLFMFCMCFCSRYLFAFDW